MKKLLRILVLSLLLTLSARADDIRDFQIEGMSIGDSALDFLLKKKLKMENLLKKNKATIKKLPVST